MRYIFIILSLSALALASLGDDPPKPADGPTLVIADAAGKEHKLKTWHFATGTRRLDWLAAAAKDGDKPPAGPEALAFREENSTTFVEGVLTLIPLERIKSIEYDDKDGVSVRVAAGAKADEDEVLKGTTKYKGINKLAIEAEVDKGDLGVAAVKFLGGVSKGGVRSLRFPGARAPAAAPAGRPSLVTIAEQKEPQKAADLMPLYRFADASERLVPRLMFKKTLKVDVAKIQKLRAVAGEQEGSEFTVTLKDGTEDTLTLLSKTTLDDKEATLVGLVGRVPAGYKLFPLHAVSEVQFDEGK